MIQTMHKIGEYDAVRELGRGGMAVVFEAAHPTLRTRHAVKVFGVPEGRHCDALREKFFAEARLLASLRHPNVVRVTDFGTLEDGRPYLVMDFVPGGSLSARLSRPVPPTPEDVARWYADVRSALAHCAEKGVVHSDVKAENVLLDEDGHALLADFGIARVVDPGLRAGLDLATLTLPGGLGTAYTLAPECRRGAKATPASDVYSFGVLLFKLVTGIWYEGSPRLLEQLRALSPAWAPLLERMLAADPAARVASAADLPSAAPDAASASRRRAAWWLIAAVVFAAAAAIAVAAVFWRAEKKPDAKKTAARPEPSASSLEAISIEAGPKPILSGWRVQKKDGVVALSSGMKGVPCVEPKPVGDVVLPKTVDGLVVTSVGDHAFGGCVDVTAMTMPETVTNIGFSAFASCGRMRRVNLPDGIERIGVFAFTDCASLEELRLPASLKSMREWTFHGCLKLREIVVPPHVESIGEYTFSKMPSLESVTFLGPMPRLDKKCFVNLPPGAVVYVTDAWTGPRDKLQGLPVRPLSEKGK